MEYIALREIENMTRKQLKQAVRDCFDYAPDASPIDRLAILQETNSMRGNWSGGATRGFPFGTSSLKSWLLGLSAGKST